MLRASSAAITKCENVNLNQQATISEAMRVIGEAARRASRTLAIASDDQKSMALKEAAKHLRARQSAILSANSTDLENGKANGLSSSMIDRLSLDADRIESIANGLEAISELGDPVGEIIAAWDRPNGLKIERVRTPLGVIGVIYESRPNVTADAGGLCLKSGNSVILRGGSDSFHSSAAIHACLTEGLASAQLPKTAIQIVPTTDRSAVGELLAGLNGNLDVLVPRGGKSLVARVQADSRIPVFSHLEGICHIYIDQSGDVEMAQSIVINSKLRRTGICGALETLLVNQQWAKDHLPMLIKILQSKGCEIRGDENVRELVKQSGLKDSGGKALDCNLASESDWTTEYLDAILSVKLVGDVEEAIEHINHYGSQHTESIITNDTDIAERFMNEIDSAILLHNASTQFADGGEFGMGAELGIATGKMHARGPVGVEQLTSFKYRVRGDGQTREA